MSSAARHFGCVLTFWLSVCAAASATAQETNHYLNGTSGLKAATLPPPGRYWLAYNYVYNSQQFNDPAGDPVPIDLNVTTYARRTGSCS